MTTSAASAQAASTAARSPISVSRARLPAIAVMDDGRAGGERRECIGDGGQHRVAHDDALGGVLRRRRGLRDDHRHGLADMAHAIRGEWRMRRIERRPPPRSDKGAQLDVVGVGGVRHVGDAAAARGGIVGRGDDREHAGQLRRSRCRCRRCGHGRGANARRPHRPGREPRHHRQSVRARRRAAGPRSAASPGRCKARAARGRHPTWFLPRFAFPLTAFRREGLPGAPRGTASSLSARGERLKGRRLSRSAFFGEAFCEEQPHAK